MFTLVDASRLLLATLVGGLVIGLPGVALARAFGLARRDALVIGLAILPLVDSLSARFLGLDAALSATLALAVAAAALLFREREAVRLPWAVLALCAVWLALVLIEWVDLDVAGGIYQPFTVIDAVKHAATTQAIVDTGAPPHDPFFLREQRVSYYYFFYMLPALVERLGFGLIDARAAVGGCVFWVGLGLYALVRLAMDRAGFAATAARRTLLIALLAAGGLDIFAVLRIGLLQGHWLDDPVYWNEQVTGWFESTLWVPHHVTALIAGFLGLMALAECPAPDSNRAARARGIGLAAACFASTLGLSVWLALALVATVWLWGVVLLVERRWRALGALALAGALALILAGPQIHDLVVGRTGSAAAAIVPTVRAFSPVEAFFAPGWGLLLARLLALPLNYFAGFGILASGAILYWRTGARARQPEFARVLVLAALAGLVLATFLKSTLFNNDLGWRVVLFPMLAALVWTIAALERLQPPPQNRAPPHRRAPAFLLALLGLGWATTAYAIVSLRTYPWTTKQADWAFMSADPATERALRVAYGWADAHLPAGAVLQHDPTRQRAFAFALYGRHPVAVADAYGSLFGADPRKVEARIAALAPLFSAALPSSEVRARAHAAGIDDLVVTAADLVWGDSRSFVWRATPAYASARVRIIPVAALAGLPDAPPAPAKSAATNASGRGG